ncbi:hypothetical protein FA95DRAFT_699327 [Auriscalpium vulgare]|uniref:Uncharacterized protein n=1 Tax=Auriscalpium vulgare TaxID=40419 RepID=A0ACB8S2A1_9AGAM|nr:hypothetical protein FA95DRAFT_699327 [Auriscalpium vulgare]
MSLFFGSSLIGAESGTASLDLKPSEQYILDRDDNAGQTCLARQAVSDVPRPDDFNIIETLSDKSLSWGVFITFNG